MKIFWRLKLKASSLVEVTTALIIISMVFGTATLIYLQAQRSSLTWQKLSASVSIDNQYAAMKKDTTIQSEERSIDFENFEIRIAISPSNQGKNLWLIRMEAYNREGLLLAEKKHLRFKSDEVE